ncbi:MAG: prepilin-type N-terminal cleavage/methylation domain-containing protein [Elusimicrobia bacterium]|nr:prepilin-type N-terminal cleavage/methylation domain-containing protein [Elusimicrobiota bacterium]
MFLKLKIYIRISSLISFYKIRVKEKGSTLVELMIAITVTLFIALVIGNLFTSTTRFLTESDTKVKADVNLRFSMDKVETSLLNADFFYVASSTEVLFSADLITDKDYSRTSDFDGDGIPNLSDPDDDNDATSIQPSTAQWRIGYDLKDDDDDNDNQVDMRWRIYLSTREKVLYLDYSKNNESWGSHVETLVVNFVSTTAFTFYGSKNDLLSQGGANLDTNNDGIVSISEIDAVANGGNGNGRLDTLAERNRIVTVGILMDRDSNNDGKRDSQLSTEVMPPALYIKRRP